MSIEKFEQDFDKPSSTHNKNNVCLDSNSFYQILFYLHNNYNFQSTLYVPNNFFLSYIHHIIKNVIVIISNNLLSKHIHHNFIKICTNDRSYIINHTPTLKNGSKKYGDYIFEE